MTENQRALSVVKTQIGLLEGLLDRRPPMVSMVFPPGWRLDLPWSRVSPMFNQWLEELQTQAVVLESQQQERTA